MKKGGRGERGKREGERMEKITRDEEKNELKKKKMRSECRRWKED